MDTAARRKEAKQLLTHYLTLIAEKAGVPLHGDCYVEMGMITDLIFDEIDDRFTPVVVTVRSDARINGPDWDEA